MLARLAAAPASGLAAVVLAGSTSGGWTLEIDANGLLDVTPLARTVEAQRIPLPLFDAIEERFSVAARTADYPADTATAKWWPAAADSASPSEVLLVDDTDLAYPDAGDPSPWSRSLSRSDRSSTHSGPCVSPSTSVTSAWRWPVWTPAWSRSRPPPAPS